MSAACSRSHSRVIFWRAIALRWLDRARSLDRWRCADCIVEQGSFRHRTREHFRRLPRRAFNVCRHRVDSDFETLDADALPNDGDCFHLLGWHAFAGGCGRDHVWGSVPALLHPRMDRGRRAGIAGNHEHNFVLELGIEASSSISSGNLREFGTAGGRDAGRVGSS